MRCVLFVLWWFRKDPHMIRLSCNDVVTSKGLGISLFSILVMCSLCRLNVWSLGVLPSTSGVMVVFNLMVYTNFLITWCDVSKTVIGPLKTFYGLVNCSWRVSDLSWVFPSGFGLSSLCVIFDSFQYFMLKSGSRELLGVTTRRWAH